MAHQRKACKWVDAENASGIIRAVDPELLRNVPLVEAVAWALEEQRTALLNRARAFVDAETASYPDAPPAVTAGIFGAFDQWAAAVIGGDV